MKRNLSNNIAERMKSMINRPMPTENYYDNDGIPQPHVDGEPQDDSVYLYYLERNIAPPWFEEYKQKRPSTIDWAYVERSLQDGRTKDETAYLIAKYYKEHGTYDGCPFNYNKTF